MCAVAFFFGGLPIREDGAPAEIDGLAPGSAEIETADVERYGCLPVAEVGHDGGQVGPCDDIKQLFLVTRQARPDLTQIVDRVDIGNDGVMAGARQTFVVETTVRPLADDRRLGHGNCAEGFAHL